VALDCLVVPHHPPPQNDGLFHTFLDNWNKKKTKVLNIYSTIKSFIPQELNCQGKQKIQTRRYTGNNSQSGVKHKKLS